MGDRHPGGPTAIVVDLIVAAGAWPPEAALRDVARNAVAAAARAADADEPCTLGLLFTTDEEVRVLNARFRGKDKPTNVLSFPAARDSGLPGEPPHLGDIALAFDTVAREAEAEGKPFEHHLAHLVVHGFLHLLGYDHDTDRDAEEMEDVERAVLEGLAIADPYA